MKIIDADKLQEQIKTIYCTNCKRTESCGTVICRACWVDDAKAEIDDAEELPTMQSDKICDYCIHCGEDTIKYCVEDEYGNSCRFEGKKVIEVE